MRARLSFRQSKIQDIQSSKSELTVVDFMRMNEEETKNSFRVDAASVLKGKSFASVKKQIKHIVETHFAFVSE